MSLKTILNAFGDVVVSTVEKNSVIKAQAGQWARSTVFYLASCTAARGWMTSDHAMFVASFAVATGLAVYGNLKTRAMKRENIALQNTNPNVNPGDTLPAETAKP